ncbi:MAG: F0F1 ATP synthase subunit alpha, partial [Planctomycetota bacterium]|nr:F0F1 ATP synthase subunit alpha [Planctomycetota bacterium]
EVFDQCISIFAGSKGLLDDVDPDQVLPFEQALLDYFAGPKKALRDKLVEARSFKGIEDDFISAMRDFKSNWVPS